MTYTPTEMSSQDWGKLFEPDTVLPEQYYATVRKGSVHDPERRLMVAVLEDVVACLSVNPNNCSRRQRLDFYSAQSWVNAPTQGEWIFSFHNICETLGIHPEYLRRGLNNWAKRCDNQTLAAHRRPDMPRYKPVRLRAVF